MWTKRFKRARAASGLSQRALGIAVGLDEFVASSRINRYELGVHKPDYTMSVRLSKVLDIPVAYLYCDQEEMATLILAFHRSTQAEKRAAMLALTSAPQ